MRLIVLQNEAMIADVVCGLEAVYVGSREGCRIQLPDARVAAQQVVIWPERNGVWTLKQLDGACEVRLNQMTVTGEADLKPGDEIQILDYAVRVYPDYDEKSPGRGALGTSRAALERFAQSKLPVGATLRKSDEPLTIHPAQLDAVARANLVVAGCVSVEEFMDALLGTLLTTFAAQRVWIGVRRVNYGPMEYEEGRLLTGQPTDLPPIGHEHEAAAFDKLRGFPMVIVYDGDQECALAQRVAERLLGQGGRDNRRKSPHSSR